MPDGLERPGRDTETALDTTSGGDSARKKERAASRELLDRAVEKKDELQRASSMAEDRWTGVVQRASSMSRALHGAADALRDNGEPQLSDRVHQAASQVARVAGYLEGKRTDGLADDLENLARNNPAFFLGATYLAGFALGRFLHAASPEHRERESESCGGPDAEPFERSSKGVGSATGNLGSTGWSAAQGDGAGAREPASPDATSNPSHRAGRRFAASADHRGTAACDAAACRH